MEDGLIDPSTQKKLIIWRIISIILIIFLVTIAILYALGIGWKKSEEEIEEIEPNQILNLWNSKSPIFERLVPYVKNVIDENNKEYFIPVEDRIAVFDLDGTLFCETDPIYFDWNMFAYRVLDDPDYVAEESDKILAQRIREAYIHDLPPDIEKEHSVRNAAIFQGMKMEDYVKYVQKFLNEDAPGYTNMKRGDAFYKPMLQVIEYLQKNNFTVFIVSGTDRFEVRTIVKGHINIPESQIIGSISTVRAIGQGDKSGLDYLYTKDDYLIMGGGFIIKNVKMNKVNTMTTEIGKKPVLSFGNSNGDSSMANFVVNHNNYKSLAFMLCCDDEKRENGNITRAEKMKESCINNNWIPISMANDWKTIYGDNVERRVPTYF